MSPDASSTTLKSGPGRLVELVPGGAGGRARVVKRYRAPGLLGRLRNARRARNEHALLVRLHAAGLPVPEPLGLERAGAEWRLSCEWIEGAVALHELLHGRAPWPRPPHELARALGEALGRFHAAGLEHADLHPGNVLVAPDGAALLIDFSKARVRAGRPAARLEAELAALCGSLRERTSWRFRQRALLGWRRATGAPREELGALARRVEAASVSDRFARLLANRRRWSRASGLCRGLPGGVAAREPSAAELEALAPRLADAPEDALEGARLAAGAEDARAFRDEGEGARWQALGRAWEHALPCARPLLRLAGAPPRFAAALPAGSRPLGRARQERQERPAGLARACGALAGALHDRGLDVVRALAGEEPWWAPDGVVRLAPGATLEPAREDASRAAAAALALLLHEPREEERAAFTAGFLDALRGGPAARDAAARELARG